jgi:hypothetical protein
MNINLKGEISFLIRPLVILASIIVVFVFVVTFGTSQITKMKSSLQVAKSSSNSLQQKVNTLETVDTVLSNDVTFLDVVLPSKGAVLYGLSQIKNLSVSNSVAISGLKTGIPVPVSGGVMKNSISFDVEGPELNMYQFLQSFSKTLPLMNIDKLNLSKSNDVVRADVSVNVYSSDMPKKIPAVTESIKDFSKEEVNILKDVSTYTLPLFIEPSVSIDQSTKQDPFSSN